MQAILFADRKPFGADPTSQRYCPALLPLGGRAAVIHSIEDLARAGIDRIHLVISAQAYQIESLLGDGSRWGVEIDYLLSRGEEQPSAVIGRYRDRLGASTLLARGDMIRSACIDEMLGHIDPGAGPVSLHFDGRPAGVMFIPTGLQDAVVDQLGWPQLTSSTESPLPKLDLTGYSCSCLEGLADFSAAALAIAANDFARVKPTGLKTESGLVHGRNSKLNSGIAINGSVILGDNVCLEQDVRLNGPVVISDDVFVDRGATLRNCVILDGTYVGSDVSLENCILDKNHIHRLDMDVDLAITDDFLAADLSLPGNHWFDRVLAVALLAVSAPLWIYAAVLASMATPRRLFQTVRINSNRASVDEREPALSSDIARVAAVEWNLSSPLLRRLPWLLNVIRGDIRLLGSDPTPIDQHQDDQLDHLQHAAYGLLSVSQIDLDGDVSRLDRMLNDFVYDTQRSVLTDIRYLIAFMRHLFQPGLWRANAVVKS